MRDREEEEIGGTKDLFTNVMFAIGGLTGAFTASALLPRHCC